MNLLGDTIEKIAAEKAGIIKSNRPVVLGAMREEARQVMCTTAQHLHAPLIDSTCIPDTMIPGGALQGNYQTENRATAFMALRTLAALGWNVTEQHISAGFQKVVELTGLLGRWQKLNERPLTIADVAHNEDGIQVVLRQLRETPHRQLHFVLGMVGDKDVSRVLRLLPREAVYYFCKADIPRGLDANALKQQASEFHLQGESFASVKQAYEAAIKIAENDDLVFIGGSVFTVAEVL
jgi:dihydrofolate synthase/folylpolyglutamate synthase